MTLVSRLASAFLLLAVAACVAPEQPEPKFVRTTPSPQVDTTSSAFQTAPTPNHAVRPASDDVIRVAQ